MALPKEPRQKMINIMYLVLTAILALNVSAEILNAFKLVDGSLTNSNKNIEAANNTLYKSLADKLADPQSAEKARIWQPKALDAQKMAADMMTYLDQLKLELKQESGLKTVDGKEEFKQDNLDASTRLFEIKGKGKELEARLKKFKEDMLNLDPEIRKAFETTLQIDVTPPISQEGHVKDFTSAIFHMTPTVAALTMLSKFQNNIKNSENQVVTFCHNQIGAVKVIYDKFQPIAGASSTYLMPGQELVVTAGVGAFNSAAKPTITIGGTTVGLNENGVAEKKFNVSGTGNQKVNVTINYTRPDGTADKLVKEIEYTVGVPGGAAVMLDKMNVFYIGVPNPITISSGSGWDKTNVSITGGTMSGSNGNRIISVTGGTAASITVTADGKSNKFDFRVKRIPDPIFKIGPSSGGSIPSAVFKSQQYCRAELENFDFDARFSVVGGTVYFTGAGFTPLQVATLTGNNLGALPQLAKCQPGTTVIFDNVKVQGPDGSVRTIQAPGFLLK
ncbi:MAG: gliding motility protein GldM [Ferruginibacter sp.]